MKVVFSNRAYTALLSEVYEKIKTETGGVFLGYYENETWYVVEAIDPGPKSIFEVAYFEYDQPYVNHLINKVARIYKRNLSLIGLWHRHPGSFDVFSGTDDGTNTTYAKMAPQGAISALVNIDPTFRLTVYHVGLPLRYKRIQYEVGDEYFPDGVLNLHTASDYINMINTYGGGGSVRRQVARVSFSEFMRELVDRLKKVDVAKYRDEIAEATKDANYIDDISKVIDDDMAFLSEELCVKFTVKMMSGYVCFVDAQNADSIASFSYVRSLERYVMMYGGDCYLYEPGTMKQFATNNSSGGKNGRVVSWLRRVLGF